MSNLYIVSTPIGNLGDVTYRAVEVLKSVSFVLAEDTRRTRILFGRYEIRTPLVSAHAHNEEARTSQLLAWLDDGSDVALVSDAGTPLVSDPGARLVRSVLERGHQVVPVPGPSALLAALVASGLEAEPFTYFGFAPRTGSARAKRMVQIAGLEHTAVIYESPNRLVRLLEDLQSACGDERRVAIGREITKRHETFFRGTLAEAAGYYRSTTARGEVVVVLAGRPEGTGKAAVPDVTAVIRDLIRSGMKPSAAAREATRRLGTPRNEAYQIALQVEGGAEE